MYKFRLPGVKHQVFDYQNYLNKRVKEIKFIRTRKEGVDVKIATDLIAGAIDNKHDTGIVVSSDSDLIPAID